MNNKNHSIRFNFIMNVILTLSSFIFPLISFPYASRILLADGIGKVSLATSIISYFVMFAQMGIPTYGIRACAKVRDDKNKLNKVVNEIFFINLCLTIISYIILFICIVFVSKFNSYKYLLIIISSTMIFNLIGMEWLYKSLEQYSYITIRSVVFKIISIILLFLFVHQESDYLQYAAISIFASSASNVFNFINLRKIIKLKINFKINKIHLKPILIFFAMSCAVTIYTNLDTIMLGFIKNDSDVGIYNVAIRIRSILLGVITSLGAVILPRASYYVENGFINEFKQISKKAISFVITISLPICLFFILFSNETVSIISGESFSDSSLPLMILLPTLVFVGLSNITGIQMLIPLDKEIHVLISEILGAIVDFIINLILINKYGYIGIAIGTLVAEFVVLVYQIIVLKKYGYSVLRELHLIKIFIACVISGLCSIIVKQFTLSNLLYFIIGAIIFFVLYYFVLIIFKYKFVVDITNEFIFKIRRKLYGKS